MSMDELRVNVKNTSRGDFTVLNDMKHWYLKVAEGLRRQKQLYWRPMMIY